MTDTELEIMLDATACLGAHSQPPPDGSDGAVDWWLDTASEMGAVARKWGSHPLAVSVLAAVYDYLGEKAKAVRR